VIDSGASDHMCNDRESFHTFKKLPKPMPIRLGNNHTVYATHHGLANITQSFQAHALFTPTFKHSLFSVSQLDISGYTSTFGGGRCIVKTQAGSTHTVLTATLGNNSIYFLDDDNLAAGSAMEADTLQEAATDDDDDSEVHFPGLPKAPPQKPAPRSSSAAQPTKQKKKLSLSESRMWHRRLAHLHPAAMRSLIDGLTHSDTTCDVCIKAKAKRKIIRIPVKPTTMPFELVHSDLCGPFSTPSHSGSRYYIIYIDDYTRYAEVYLLADKKAESCVAAFQAYQAQAKARGYNIQRFRCDNGRGEYDNAFFRGILRVSGISFEPSPPYSQHKNGVSERLIGVITEKARAMMIDSQAPLEFWGEAVMSAAYLHRRTPSRALGSKTPWEMLHSHIKNKNGDAEPVGQHREKKMRAARRAALALRGPR
jgi:transposase InsO family protein